jgi:hypothetical protein
MDFCFYFFVSLLFITFYVAIVRNKKFFSNFLYGNTICLGQVNKSYWFVVVMNSTCIEL